MTATLFTPTTTQWISQIAFLSSKWWESPFDITNGSREHIQRRRRSKKWASHSMRDRYFSSHPLPSCVWISLILSAFSFSNSDFNLSSSSHRYENPFDCLWLRTSSSSSSSSVWTDGRHIKCWCAYACVSNLCKPNKIRRNAWFGFRLWFQHTTDRRIRTG